MIDSRLGVRQSVLPNHSDLERRVAELEKLVSQLVAVIKIQDAGATVTIRASDIRINADRNVDVKTGSNLSLSSSSSISMRSGGPTAVTGFAGLDLRASMITLNQGVQPVNGSPTVLA